MKKRIVKNASCTSLITVLKIGTVFQCLFYKMTTFALAETKLVTGGKELIADATTVLLAIEAGAVVLLEIKTLIQYQKADTEEKPKHKKAAQEIVVVGVLIVCVTSLIKVILSYFM